MAGTTSPPATPAISPTGTSHAGFDAFNDNSNPGVINALTSADVVNMAALGWTVTGAVSSGVVVVSSGQTSTGVVLSSGNQLTVLSGGITSGTQVSNVGTEVISLGGVANGTVVLAGGDEFVAGVASGTTVSALGLEHVLAGGVTVGENLIGSGAGNYARENVSSGGIASGTTVSDTGVLTVLLGGLAVGTIVNSTDVGVPNSDGALIVSAGGTASGAVVNFSGLLNVRAGGLEVGGLVHGGGSLSVISGTTVSNSLIGSGLGISAIERVSSGGVASAAFLSNTGILIVSRADPQSAPSSTASGASPSAATAA